MIKTFFKQISTFAEPLEDTGGTTGFRGTPVEKHCLRDLIITVDSFDLVCFDV